MVQTPTVAHAKRRIVFACCGVLIASVTGCMATESQVGDAVVVKSTILNSLLLMVVGGGICGFGVTVFYQGLRSEKGRGESRNPIALKILAAFFGIGAIACGAAVLIIGVPYSFVAHITIHPDRVVMRDSVLWFANGDRAISYLSVAQFSRVDKPISRKNRKKEDLVIRYTSGASERIEMGPRERAAFDKLVQAHREFISENPQSVETQEANLEVVSREKTSHDQDAIVDAQRYANEEPRAAEPSLTEKQAEQDAEMKAAIEMRLSAETTQMIPSGIAMNSGSVPAPRSFQSSNLSNINDATPVSTLKRRPINIPLPSGTSVLTAETPLVEGVKLGACWAHEWDTVTLVRVLDNGNLTVKWDSWGSVYDMRREDLIISERVLRDVRKRLAFVRPIQREWSDQSGGFQITATYVDSKDGFVLLRKSDGNEISVPIAKLSKTDQSVVARLSRGGSR